MSDQPKPGRLFIDIHLRQWTPGVHVVRLRDLDGNVVELDGLIHDRPHQFILIELTESVDDKGVVSFAVPGVFADYHPHNGRELGSHAPELALPDNTIVPAGKVKRVPHAQPKVRRDSVRGLVWMHNGEPVHPAPVTPEGKPAERGENTPAVAQAPLGVHRPIVPPK